MSADPAGIARDIPTAADIRADHTYVAQAPRTIDDARSARRATAGRGWARWANVESLCGAGNVNDVINEGG